MEPMFGNQSSNNNQIANIPHVHGKIQSSAVINRLNEIQKRIDEVKQKREFCGNFIEIDNLVKEAHVLTSPFFEDRNYSIGEQLIEIIKKIFSSVFGPSENEEIEKKNWEEIKTIENNIIRSANRGHSEVHMSGAFYGREKEFVYKGINYVNIEITRDKEFLLQTKEDYEAGKDTGLYYHAIKKELKCDGKPIHSLQEAGEYYKALVNRPNLSPMVGPRN